MHTDEILIAAGHGPAAVICAASRQPDGAIEFVPFATMFQGNPYRTVNPPKAEGGFWSQEEMFHE